MKPDYLASPTICILIIGCFLLTLILTPLAMKLAHLIGAIDREGHRGVCKRKALPLLGGLAVALPFIAICLLALLRPSSMFSSIISNHRAGLLVLACGGLGILALGIIDDTFGLRARSKFSGQVVLASLACFAGYTIQAIDLPLCGRLPLGPVLGTVLTLFWIVGLTNAYNLIDGIDGLATGLALIAAVGLASISMLNGSTFPALMCVALGGSLLAFLIYNFHPARIFLGDTGSLFLGYALANITLMGSLKTTGAVIFMAPILVLGLPIMDTIISILRRYLCGRPLFTGDQGHIHHRLLKRGYTQRQVALTLYAIASLMTGSAVAGWALPARSPLLWLAYGGYGLAILAVIWITGLRPSMLLQMAGSRKRNQVMNALSRYVSMRLNERLGTSPLVISKILALICQELRLRYLVVKCENGQRLTASDPGQESPSESADQPIWRMKVRLANKGILYLTFQHENILDEMTATDINACLASIFEQTRFSMVNRNLTPLLADQARHINRLLIGAPIKYSAGPRLIPSPLPLPAVHSYCLQAETADVSEGYEA